MGKSTAKTLTARFGLNDPDLQTPKHDAIICWFEENALELVKPWAHGQNGWKPADVEQIVETCRKYEAPCEIPPYPTNPEDLPRISGCEWEPIVKKRDSTARLGFMDLSITVTFPILNLDTSTTDVVIEHNKKAKEYHNTPSNWVPDQYRIPVPWTPPKNRYSHDDMEWKQLVLVPHPQLSVFNRNRRFWIEAKPTIPSLGELFRQLNVYAEGIRKEDMIVVSPDDRHAQRIRDQGYKFIKAPEEL